jgi:hypothetical protein
VTWAPAGRVRRAQGAGPQEAVGVTAVPACHTPLALRHDMVTADGTITPAAWSAAVIHTAAEPARCGSSQVAWTEPPVPAGIPSRASANCGP